MANTLANLLNCVGIPQPWTEDILKECFELFWTNKLYELEERRKCKERCHCKDREGYTILLTFQLTECVSFGGPHPIFGLFGYCRVSRCTKHWNFNTLEVHT